MKRRGFKLILFTGLAVALGLPLAISASVPANAAGSQTSSEWIDANDVPGFSTTTTGTSSLKVQVEKTADGRFATRQQDGSAQINYRITNSGSSEIYLMTITGSKPSDESTVRKAYQTFSSCQNTAIFNVISQATDGSTFPTDAVNKADQSALASCASQTAKAIGVDVKNTGFTALEAGKSESHKIRSDLHKKDIPGTSGEITGKYYESYFALTPTSVPSVPDNASLEQTRALVQQNGGVIKTFADGSYIWQMPRYMPLTSVASTTASTPANAVSAIFNQVPRLPAGTPSHSWFDNTSVSFLDYWRAGSSTTLGQILRTLILAIISAGLLGAGFWSLQRGLTKHREGTDKLPSLFSVRFGNLWKEIPGGFALPVFAITALLVVVFEGELNLSGLRLGMTVFISLLLLNYIGGGFARLFTHRKPTKLDSAFDVDVPHKQHFILRPIYVLAMLVCLIASAVLHSNPIWIVGILLGVAVSPEVSRWRAGLSELFWLVFLSAVGVASWAGFTTLARFSISDLIDQLGRDKIDVALFTSVAENIKVVGGEFLAVLAIASLTSLLFHLLPITGAGGKRLWDWTPVVWGIAYTVGLSIFSLVLAPVGSSWSEFTPFPVWAWVYTVLGIVAGVFGLLLPIIGKRSKTVSRLSTDAR